MGTRNAVLCANSVHFANTNPANAALHGVEIEDAKNAAVRKYVCAGSARSLNFGSMETLRQCGGKVRFEFAGAVGNESQNEPENFGIWTFPSSGVFIICYNFEFIRLC